MGPHNTRDEFRQLLKAGNIDTFLPINPVGRIYSATFIDHIAGIVANDPVLRKEFSANVFNELYLVCKEERTIAGQPSEQKHEQRSHTANPVSGIVDTVLDLVDTCCMKNNKGRFNDGKNGDYVGNIADRYLVKR